MHRLNTANEPIPFPRSAMPRSVETTQCAWCETLFTEGEGFGVFCSQTCCEEEGEQGTGSALQSRAQVAADVIANGGRTLSDQLIMSLFKAQTARIEKLEQQVRGLLAREVV